ncbi:MAG: hypothetical protein FWE38_01920 [Firmicutes bacterium]|nr:hypothetical protein [Bacillota bacterium]
MKILMIDTVSRTMRVSLVVNGAQAATRESEMSPTDKHDKRVVPLVNDVMGGLSFDEIDAYALNVGPGGFTGPRVGVAVVKAFSMVHPKPIITFDEWNIENINNKYRNKDFVAIENLEPIYGGDYHVTPPKFMR